MNKLVLSILILGNSIIATSQQGINVHSTPKKAARTTSIGSRWYNYADSFFALAYVDSACNPVVIGSVHLPLWADTSGTFPNLPDTGYTSNIATSVGLICRPTDSWWNNPTYFVGEIAVTDTDNYVVDSVIAMGSYGRNPGKPLVIDSLRFGIVYGNGDTTRGDLPQYYIHAASLYCVDTVFFLQMFYDSINKAASNALRGTTSTGSRNMETYPLYEADSSTTGFMKSFALSPSTGGYHVPAGNAFGVSVSFITGDLSYPTTGTMPRDTIKRRDGTYKYNSFMPEIVYNSTAGYDESFYDLRKDWTTGFYSIPKDTTFYKQGLYVDNWAIPLSIEQRLLQYPGMIFHVSCTTCRPIPPRHLEVNNIGSLASIKIYPNPADGILNIEYTLGSATNVRIVLKNILGQIVVSKQCKQLGSSVSGKGSIDTRELPNGVYFYEFYAGEGFETGKVVVAH